MTQAPQVLCVDDDPHVLGLLHAQLVGRFGVLTAPSGEEGLELIASSPGLAVVISDMRMPGMNGVQFLTRVRQQFPNIVRILLTGQADLGSTIDAVNDGRVFRFLTKPPGVSALRLAVEDGVTHHRLVSAERVLLQETLLGSINALTDALALASPLAFGRAMRIKQLMADLVVELGMQESWQVEVAAMFSQLAWITLPIETVTKQHSGESITPEEQAMIDRLPAITEQLLGHIPRLEVVRAIVLGATAPGKLPGKFAPADIELAVRGAAMLRLANGYDELELAGRSPETAISILRSREDGADLALLEALERVKGHTALAEVKTLLVTGLRLGMILLDDVILPNGLLLVSHGSTVTSGLLERIHNLPRGEIREPIRVQLPKGPVA